MTICKPCYGQGPAGPESAVRPYKVSVGNVGDEGKDLDMKNDPEDEEDDDAQIGARKVRKMNEPRSPTSEERIAHGYLHLPYRSWCEHCVKGKGKEAPHRQGGDKPEIPEFHADFMFAGDEEGGVPLRSW